MAGMLQWLAAQPLPPQLPAVSAVATAYCPGVIALTILYASGLFPKDFGSKVEAFCLVACGAIRRRSPVAQRSLSPEWNFAVQLVSRSHRSHQSHRTRRFRQFHRLRIGYTSVTSVTPVTSASTRSPR